MAGVSLGGLASGLDTNTMIAQLMALEQRPKLVLQTEQRRLDGRKALLEEVARQLRGLTGVLADLRSPTTFAQVQKVTSSDTSKVGASVVGPAPAGSVTVEIGQMASAEQRSYLWRATTGFEIDGLAIDLDGVAGAAEAAAKINATSGISVYAGVVNNQLVLTGKTLGKDVVVTGADALTEDATRFVDGVKTQYKVNGIPQDETIESVVRPGGLPGIELTLKARTDAPVTLSTTAPSADPDKVKLAVKAFVEAYNKSVDLLRSKLSEEKLKTASTAGDLAKGSLRNDVTLTGLASKLRQGVNPADSTAAMDSLAEIGIALPAASSSGTSSADALAGRLTLDEAKLAAAMAADPAAVQSILASASSSLAAAIEPIAKVTTGYLARGAQSADEERGRIGTRLTAMDRRLAAREERLRAQFTAMESALNASQSQNSWLQGQIAGLSGPGR
jgi:flagellar hook-associated protein 2